MLTSGEFFRLLIESDDPEELAEKTKALAGEHVGANVAIQFEPNKVPLELIRGMDGSLWDVFNHLDKMVDAIVKLAGETAKYSRDGSLREESASEPAETTVEGPPTTPNQP